MSYIPRLAVAPGAGRLARRDRALLYLPNGASADVIERFRKSAHDTLPDVLTGHVLDDPDSIPAFVFIEWPNGAATTRIQVIVRGDVEIFSDLDSMPSLSGTGSATWVEHRVARTPDAARFRCGAPADADTDLGDGLVDGGGFELHLAVGAEPPPSADQGAPPQGETSMVGRRDVDPSPPATDRDHEPSPEPDVPPVAPERSDRGGRLDRIASLEAAGGGDVMGASLELGTTPVDEAENRPVTTPGGEFAVDDGSGPPLFPGDEQRPPTDSAQVRPVRHEETLLESALVSQPDPPNEVSARSVVAEVELPDGTRHNVSTTVVLGRQPDGNAARAADAVIIRLDASASVSRTHLRLSLDGRQLFATDCSSSGGTVLIPSGDLALVHLEPWVPHAVGNDDRLYLGGRETSVAIHCD